MLKKSPTTLTYADASSKNMAVQQCLKRRIDVIKHNKSRHKLCHTMLLVSKSTSWNIIVNAEGRKYCIKAKYATMVVDLCASIFILHIYSRGKISHELCKFWFMQGLR